MKKTLTTLVLLLSAAAVVFAAGNPSLEKIEKTGKELRSAESHFLHNRTIQASGKVIKMEGNLFYSADDRLAMRYTKPSTDLLVIDGTKFFLSRGGVSNTFDTSKNPMMESLRSTLLDCVAGRVEKVASGNNADLAVKEDASSYIVTLTARQKAVRGYSRIVLTYRKSDCFLVKMRMEEFTGVTNTYIMDKIVKNPTVSSESFKYE